MKTASLISSLVLGAMFIGPMAAAAVTAPLGEQPAAQTAAPQSGVRFVICSPAGETLPSPMYCKQGKSIKPIRLGARNASERVTPEGGVVRFWKEDPGAIAGEEGKGGKAAKKAEMEALPEPDLTIKVPSGAGAKALCILVPASDLSKTQSFFLNESDFPKSGMHLINFSPYPLQVVLSAKGDFSDKKVDNVSFFKRDEGIRKENSWSYRGKDGETVAFMLMYKDGKSKQFKRARASRFVVSERQSQITIVVKDAARDAVKMVSVQLTDSKPAAPVAK